MGYSYVVSTTEIISANRTVTKQVGGINYEQPTSSMATTRTDHLWTFLFNGYSVGGYCMVTTMVKVLFSAHATCTVHHFLNSLMCYMIINLRSASCRDLDGMIIGVSLSVPHTDEMCASIHTYIRYTYLCTCMHQTVLWIPYNPLFCN